MTSKIKIKIGQIEIEYEGSEDFLKEELPSLLEAVTELYKETGSVIESQAVSTSPLAQSSDVVTSIGPETLGTINSISAKLSPKTGTDLALAAAASLVLGKKMQQFTRKQLLEEMQNATQYYKASFGKNLTPSLKTLVTDHKFIERAKDTYALKADVVQTLESQLA